MEDTLDSDSFACSFFIADIDLTCGIFANKDCSENRLNIVFCNEFANACPDYRLQKNDQQSQFTGRRCN